MAAGRSTRMLSLRCIGFVERYSCGRLTISICLHTETSTIWTTRGPLLVPRPSVPVPVNQEVKEIYGASGTGV